MITGSWYSRACPVAGSKLAATKYQIAPVARDLGVEHLVCTQLVVEDGQFTGATDGPMLWGRHKASGVRSFARGCMKTSLVLKEKARQFREDADIQALLKEIPADGVPSYAKYSPEAGRKLKEYGFSREELGSRGKNYEQLDQYVFDLLTGAR